MKATFLFMLGIVATGLTACAGTPDCLENQAYMDAKSFPPLESPPGLDVPEPDSAMQIPEVERGPVGKYDEAPAHSVSSDPRARCLTSPPAMSS